MKEFQVWVDAYALPLLRWALRRTGSCQQAEELVQEVWLQFFAAVLREEQASRPVSQPEHLLWKVAKYVWCKQLREQRYRREPQLPPEGQEDFTAALADEEERRQLTAWLHRRIINLSRQQREIMILYYIDQVPQKEIAARLHLTEGAVRWHLFDTRRRLREEHQTMEHTTDYVYRPGRLHMAICGMPVPELATTRINQSLLMQNILLHCYHQGRTPQEISSALGVAAAYVEHNLQWLKEQEFITEERGRYYTSFLIQDGEYGNKVCKVFFENKEAVSLTIIRYLLEKEEAIRALGFVGCDKPMDKLLWLLIYHFARDLSLPVEKPTPPFRPDGGRYNPLGFDRTKRPAERLREDWDANGPMKLGDFYWYGLYNFGKSDIETLMDSYTPEWNALRILLEKLIENSFDLNCVTEEEQYRLAQLAEKGFLLMRDGKAAPTFVIFTKEQYAALKEQIFRPLEEALQPALKRMAADFHSLSLRTLPKHLQHLASFNEAMDMMDVSFITELIAFKEGCLYKPQGQRDGEFLTLCYVKP